MLDELIAAADKEVGEYKAAVDEMTAKKDARDEAQTQLDASIGVAESQRSEASQALQALLEVVNVSNF